MDALLAVTVLVAVAAITPGPNNFIVMHTAAHAGTRATLAVIAGVVGGGLAMLVLAMLGIGAAADAVPGLRSAIALTGAMYLAWLGGRIVVASYRPAKSGRADPMDSMPVGMLGLFGFQFLNPKSWTMVLAVAASAGAGATNAIAWVWLVLVFLIVPSACLALWSGLGTLIATRIEQPCLRARIDRTMGVLLILSALLLASSGVNPEPAR